MRGARRHSVNAIKSVLDEMLERELSDTKFNITASYVMANKKYLFCAKVKGKQIDMCINIKTVSDFLKQSDLPEILCIYYCVFYIVNYLKQLENSTINSPTTYFEGLATVNAIHHCNCRKNVKIFSPLICYVCGKKTYRLRTIDMLCDTNALMRLKFQFVHQISDLQKGYLDELINARMLYLDFPEITYNNRIIPSLTIGNVLKELREICKATDINVENNKILQGMNMSDDESFITSLVGLYQNTQSPFWLGILMRVTCCAPKTFEYITDQNMLHVICKCATEYQSSAAGYYDEYNKYDLKILKENFNMILRVLQKINDQLVSKNWVVKTRTIHTVY